MIGQVSDLVGFVDGVKFTEEDHKLLKVFTDFFNVNFVIAVEVQAHPVFLNDDSDFRIGVVLQVFD